MNRDSICTTVLSRLGRQEGNAYLLAQAKTELGLIQEQLEGSPLLPWFLISTEQTLAITANSRSVALPSDFLREYENFPLYLYDSTQTDPYTRLNKDEFDVLEDKYSGELAGTPTEYALDGVSLEFFVTPNENMTARWKYYQKQSVLSDSVQSNQWTINASDLLIAMLGEVMAGYKKDTFWMAKFASDAQIARGRLLAFTVAREQASRDIAMGGKD